MQFKKASVESKIVFANVEFLWAMPMANISPDKKRSYTKRWFNDSEVVKGDRHFFSAPHTVANAGPAYLFNKYWELIALLRVMSLVASDEEIVDVASAKKRVAKLSYSAIYDGAAKEGRFAVDRVCGVHSALLHLAEPDTFESIISETHKRQITNVFEHVVLDNPGLNREQKISLIRKRLSNEYGDKEDPDHTRRWFFYLPRVKPLWIDKSSASQQLNTSIEDEVHREQLAQANSEEEGKKEEAKGYRFHRSAKLAAEAKNRDNFTCRACQFKFRRKIVHVHHLDPLSEWQSPKKTTVDDLVTLCPNCHYIAHYWLRQSEKYKDREELLRKLQSTMG